MMKKVYISLSSLILLLAACGLFKSAEDMYIEATSKRDLGEPKESIILLRQLISKYAVHEKAPDAQYLIAEIYYRDLRDFSQAIDEYETLKNDFPNSAKVPFALFMQGFVYANMLSDFKLAKKYYTEFLNKFSDHELAESVSFELKYLGLDINEIPTLKHLTKTK